MYNSMDMGWTPLLFTLWSDDLLIGAAPLSLRKMRFSNYACNLDGNLYPPCVFNEKYREFFYTQLLTCLHSRHKCQSVIITFDAKSADLNVFKKVCEARKLGIRFSKGNGRAIIAVTDSFDVFYSSLNRNIRKEFRRLQRRLDKLGSWKISCSGIDSNSAKKILDIDKSSWKTTWRSKRNIPNDSGLHSLLKVSQQTDCHEQLYSTKVWFLEVNQQPIAFQMVIFYKSTAVFIKTSFNNKFKKCSPGKFLMNAVIKESFSAEAVKRIDFSTNLPVVKAWNTQCEERTDVHVQRDSVLSKLAGFWMKNRLIQKCVKIGNKTGLSDTA